MIKFTAIQIANFLDGTLVGNPDVEIFKVSKIEDGDQGSLTFLSNPKYNNYIYLTKASVTIVNHSFKPEKPITTTLIKVDDAYVAFSNLLDLYNQAKNNQIGIEQFSVISDSASYGKELYLGSFSYIGNNVKIGNSVKIHPNCYIGDNVTIGDNCILFAGVKVYSDSMIGENCTFHSGCIIGSDGFGFAPKEDGTFKKIPQIGNVIIEDNVEIGSCTTIDRATMGSTVLKKGVKLDNHIQIAHNVEIGENTVIAAQSGIAGSSKIGKNCMIGGQVGIAGHLTIGNYVKIQAQSGIGRNIKDHETLQGSPAMGYSDYNKSYVHFKNLQKIVAEMNQLKKEILNLKNNSNG
jgi:UDP-3-O-[3-hydroxymyristoyl] glucosamine N-acyltransferase